jgi:hypothetical protein
MKTSGNDQVSALSATLVALLLRVTTYTGVGIIPMPERNREWSEHSRFVIKTAEKVCFPRPRRRMVKKNKTKRFNKVFDYQRLGPFM